MSYGVIQACGYEVLWPRCHVMFQGFKVSKSQSFKVINFGTLKRWNFGTGFKVSLIQCSIILTHSR